MKNLGIEVMEEFTYSNIMRQDEEVNRKVVKRIIIPKVASVSINKE